MKFIRCICLVLVCANLTHQFQSEDPSSDCAIEFDEFMQGNILTCKLEAINKEIFNTTFSSLGQIEAFKFICSSETIPSTFHGLGFDANFANLNILAFHNCLFQQLPSNLFLELKNLKFLHIEIKEGPNISLKIEDDAFKGLEKLELLQLIGTRVDSLPRGFLRDMPDLQYLVLRNNSLTNTEIFSDGCEQSQALYPKLVYLDLSENFIESVGDFCAVPNLKFLNLTLNKISQVTLTNLSSLEILDMSRNNITQFPHPYFSTLLRLHIFNVSANQLISFPNFTYNTWLTDINLEYNKLTEIPDFAFMNSPGMTYLDLSGNEITTAGNFSLISVKSLDILRLHGNRFKTLPPDIFSDLTKVTIIFLQNNQLDKIPEPIFTNCLNLKYLDLSNNSLTEFPHLFYQTNLELLDLSQNLIEDASTSFLPNPNSIIAISLKNNLITRIKSEFLAGMINVTVINLSYNKISEIEKGSFNKTEKLVSLRLDHNNLDSVDGIFKYYIPSHYLSLSHNYLTQLDYSQLSIQLDILDIGNNRITSLIDTLRRMPNSSLKHIHMSYNKLERIPRNYFPPQMITADLSWNNISQIVPWAFGSFNKLVSVNLEANMFKTINVNSLRTAEVNVTGRPRLKLSGSKLYCDCDTVRLTTINGGHIRGYFYIEDLSSIYCWRHYVKFMKPLKLIEGPAGPEDFLCPFKTHTFIVTHCFQHNNVTICEFTCPDACQCFHDQPWNMIIVDCSNSLLTATPVNVPPRVTKYWLDGNDLQELHDKSFEYHPSLKYLYLNSSGIVEVRDGTFAKMPNLLELYLQGNKIANLTSGVFTGLTKLEILHLDHNFISSMSNAIFSSLTSLHQLTLSSNQLTTWPVWMLEPLPLSRVTLSNNPWSCECDYIADYRGWLQNGTTAIADSSNLRCLKPDGSTIDLINYNQTDCLDLYQETILSQIPLLAGIVSTFTVIVTISVLVFVFRHEMQVYVYSRYGVRFFKGEEDDDVDKVYDAFVSYSNDDEEFVARVLAPGLEAAEDPFRLCLHHRDFAVGAYITESIMEAVEKSKRTILVLSENFIKSEWCRFEFKTAHLQMMKDRRKRVIVVILGKVPQNLDPEMKLYLKTNTYLECKDRIFWQKLRYAMPSPRQHDRGNEIDLAEQR